MMRSGNQISVDVNVTLHVNLNNTLNVNLNVNGDRPVALIGSRSFDRQ